MRHKLGLTTRPTVALSLVFLLSAGFYLWIAGSSTPFSLHGGLSDRYNLLASALLHFHLSIGRAPAALMHLANPYDPSLNNPLIGGVNDAHRINDDAFYHGRLYFVWGPTPALLLLLPLHLLGLEPSASVTVAFYGIVGLGFSLAILRIIVRRIGDSAPLWICVLAGFALSFSSAVPFILRTPSASEDVLAGGFCFTMIGIWIVASALARGTDSWKHLALASLCFGLAAGARPALGLTAVVLLPLYLSLRPRRSRPALLGALALPVGACLVLLLAYNQVRFHDPFEIGSHYQLAGYDSRTAPLGHLSYIAPGAGFYALTPPRASILFPFILLAAPQRTPPAGLASAEITGGLLPMVPVVVFLVALPWIWWRRPKLLGRLAPALMLLAAAGIAIVLLAAYEFFASTERYEVDFVTLFVLGGLASWLSLSIGEPSLRRRILRVGGGVLAAWSCIMGFAISFVGYGAALPLTHSATWRTFEDIGSPLSTAIAAAVGHPVLAAVSAKETESLSSGYPSFGTTIFAFNLRLSEQTDVVIVSPDKRSVTLTGTAIHAAGSGYAIRIDGPGSARSTYPLGAGSREFAILVQLNRGLNRLAIRAISGSAERNHTTTPIMLVRHLALAAAR